MPLYALLQQVRGHVGTVRQPVPRAQCLAVGGGHVRRQLQHTRARQPLAQRVADAADERVAGARGVHLGFQQPTLY
jgi:hypothetical protein